MHKCNPLCQQGLARGAGLSSEDTALSCFLLQCTAAGHTRWRGDLGGCSIPGSQICPDKNEGSLRTRGEGNILGFREPGGFTVGTYGNRTSPLDIVGSLFAVDFAI